MITYTLVWLLIAPVVPGGIAKDQSVYFYNRLSADECYQKKQRLEEFTTPTPDVVKSQLQCIPVPR